MISVGQIQEAVAQHAGISVTELLSRRRKHAPQRQLAMFLARELTLDSYPKLAGEFAGRDYTTIMHGCNAVSERMRSNVVFAHQVAQLKQRLSS